MQQGNVSLNILINLFGFLSWKQRGFIIKGEKQGEIPISFKNFK